MKVTIEKAILYTPDMLELRNGSVFFAGGWKEEAGRIKFQREVWVYSPNLHSIEHFPDLSDYKAGPALIELDGYVYVFGGMRKGYHLKGSHRYLLQTKEREYLPYLPCEMREVSATSYAKMIFLCYTPNLAIMRYDPASATYTPLMKTSSRCFSQLMCSVQIDKDLFLICNRNSQVADLTAKSHSNLRIVSNSAPKKCVSIVVQRQNRYYFVSKSEQSAFALYEVRFPAGQTVALTMLGQLISAV